MGVRDIDEGRGVVVQKMDGENRRDPGELEGFVLEELALLATARVNDGVTLAAKEADALDIAALDLRAVACVKRHKDGALEVCFHDRLRTLELLLTHACRPRQTGPDALARMLESATKSLESDSDA